MEEIGIIHFRCKPWIVGIGFSKMNTIMSCFFPRFLQCDHTNRGHPKKVKQILKLANHIQNTLRTIFLRDIH